MNPLLPSAYAPYRDPRDYILSWTDTIWIDRAIGRLGEHYSEDIKVHTAYGETYDYDSVISNSVQKFAAFPNGGGGHGEDVVWEQRGLNGFISFHRVLKTGTHSGFWTYGPPTGRDFISRTVARIFSSSGPPGCGRESWEFVGAPGVAESSKTKTASPIVIVSPCFNTWSLMWVPFNSVPFRLPRSLTCQMLRAL